MDLDLFDDILGENSTKNARAGGKFQPKAKPRQVKKNLGATSVTNSQPVPTGDVSENVFNAFSGITKPASSDDDRSFGLVNAPLDHHPSTENVNSSVALDSVMDGFMPDSNDDWHSCFENPMGESADIFIGLESLDDFLPDSTTVLDNPVPSSEAPNVHVSGSRGAEHRLASPLNPAVDDSVNMSNIHNISQPESSASQDPLTGADPIVATNHSITDNKSMETEELQAYPCLENLDMSKFTSSSGQRIGKFQPKLKMQVHRQRNDTDIHNLSGAEPVNDEQHTPFIPPSVDVVDLRSGPASTEDDVIDFSSMGLSNAAPSHSTSEVLADEAPMDFVGVSHQEAGIPGENLEAVPEMPGKLVSRWANTGTKVRSASDHFAKEQASTSNETTVAGRALRKRKKSINAHKLIDESEDEGLEDGDLPAESLSNSVVNEDEITDEEFQVDDELQKKKVRNKSKKPVDEKDKPIRKRKKATESSEQAAKAAPKKFSHRTQRRKVDKALLETPEDEIDFRKVPLRDLILLAEHKQQTAKKEAKTSHAQRQNQRNGNHTVDGIKDGAANAFEPFGENETFASAQGGEVYDDEESLRGEESASYFNYQTYMDKTPRSRWSKQDTELFYQAVRQFGTDLSMIQHLFPGRTRNQIKLKYKKEERQHPLRLREALSNPAKDHSHFELVIERLKQIAAEENQNTNRADSVSLTGEEEMVEETPEADVNMDEEAKSEQIDDAVIDTNMKPDVPETQSPMESFGSEEDDFLRWSQYKSEL